jgi:hypothetical protein
VTDAAWFGPRLICGGILLGVELDLVVSSKSYVSELVDAALPALHRADDTAVPR